MENYDPYDTTPRKAPQPRSQIRRKQGDGSLPITPAKTPHIQDNARQGGYEGTPRSDIQTPIRRPRKTPSTNKTYKQASAPIPIASLDGTTSASLSPEKSANNQNHAQQNKIMTPAKQAYAGPTFHASPAPSSLPIPKFFSRSVPRGASQTLPQAHLGTSPTPQSMPPSPGPADDSLIPQPPIQREQSPLDLFFNAHRAEQARQKAGEVSQLMPPRPQSFDVQALSQSSTSTRQYPQSGLSQHQLRTEQRPSGKEMFMLELDGADDQHAAGNEARAIPFNDRISAARNAPGQFNSPSKGTTDEQERLAKSLALKQLLKVMPAASEPVSYDERLHSHGKPSMNGSPAHGLQPMESSQYSSSQPVSTYQPMQGITPRPKAHLDGQNMFAATGSSRPIASQNYSHAPDVKIMEADLRRLLKLDPRP